MIRVQGDLKAASGSLMNKTFLRQMIRHWSEYRPIIEAAGLEFRIVSHIFDRLHHIASDVFAVKGETNSLAR